VNNDLLCLVGRNASSVALNVIIGPHGPSYVRLVIRKGNKILVSNAQKVLRGSVVAEEFHVHKTYDGRERL